MATRTITTRLALDGEEAYKKELASVNSELRNLKSEMKLAEETFKDQANSVEALTAKDEILRREVAQQEEKVRSLTRAVEDASAAYGETDRRTDGYRQSLNRAKTELIKLNRELADNERYLDEAKRSSDGYAKSIDGMGREVKESADSMDNLGGGLNGLLGSAGPALGTFGAIAGGATALVSAINGVVESTEEWRKIMGTLEVSSQMAGYSAEQTEEAYGRLYAVLGDTQTAATTVANLQAIGVEQEVLMDVIDNAIGAWAKYGDSISIDGLAEAINETIKAGQVTGNFADVLNWGAKEGETYGVKLKKANEANEEWNKAVENCSSAEDYFNLALQECQTEAERVNLVLQVLADQGLKDAADAWFDLNEDIVEANEATNRLDQALGELGERLSPVSTGLRELGAIFVEDVIDSMDRATEATDEWKKSLEEASISWKYIGDRFFGRTDLSYEDYVAAQTAAERVPTNNEAALNEHIAVRNATSAPAVQQSASIQDIQNVAAATANAVMGAQQGLPPMSAHISVQVSGQELASVLVDDMRAAFEANPEVTDDR